VSNKKNKSKKDELASATAKVYCLLLRLW